MVVPAGFEPAECQIQSLMPYHLAMGQFMVTRMGFEPMYVALRGLCVRPLHQRAIKAMSR